MRTASEFGLTQDLIADRTRRFIEDLRIHGHTAKGHCPYCRVANDLARILEDVGRSSL